MAFSPQFYHTWIKIRWHEGSVSFVEITLKRVIKSTEKLSPCVKSIVKSSSRNGLEILQN